MKSSNVFDRILSSTPLNRTAGTVTSSGRSGVYQPKGGAGLIHKGEPPATRKPSSAELGCSSFEDLSGRRFGYFSVIGIWDWKTDGGSRGDQKQSWVVRCVCGQYETRSAKAIRNPKNAGDRCISCRHTQNLRDREAKKAMGIIPANSVESSLARLKQPARVEK